MTATQTFANIKSGFFISLIALPLCLGIAIASSFPPIAGIITAIVGGLLVSFIGGSELSIKGPAAGLIVIVLGSVTELGQGDVVLGYKRTLAVLVVAGLLQIVFALFKMARFGRLMPPSIVHGMLAAIGIIIISKQIHILMGVKPTGKTPFQLISEIPSSILNVNPELAVMGVITLILMIIIPMIPARYTKSIPPALMALFIVIPLSLFWRIDFSHTYTFLSHSFRVGPEYLVSLPDNIFQSMVFPDFSILTSWLAYKHALLFAVVGSIESVLTVIAVDSLSKEKKKSNLNRDLLGIGVGNTVAALIGGLPMISEVVRSKANIDSGAKSRYSNFFHGAFLLLAISLFAPIIKEIPLAALAAMLIVVGFRLASPRLFFSTYKIGADQLILFLSTLVTTLATDLLMGVALGLVVKLILHLIRGVKFNELFHLKSSVIKDRDSAKIVLEGPVIFTNYSSLQTKILNLQGSNTTVKIDVTNVSLLDHTTLSCLETLKQDLGDEKLFIHGLNRLNAVSTHKLATHKTMKT